MSAVVKRKGKKLVTFEWHVTTCVSHFNIKHITIILIPIVMTLFEQLNGMESLFSISSRWNSSTLRRSPLVFCYVQETFRTVSFQLEISFCYSHLVFQCLPFCTCSKIPCRPEYTWWSTRFPAILKERSHFFFFWGGGRGDVCFLTQVRRLI